LGGQIFQSSREKVAWTWQTSLIVKWIRLALTATSSSTSTQILMYVTLQLRGTPPQKENTLFSAPYIMHP